MEEFFASLADNATWIFSGIGVAAAGWLVRIYFNKRPKKSTQTIHSGDNSVNTQAVRDANVRVKKK